MDRGSIRQGPGTQLSASLSARSAQCVCVTDWDADAVTSTHWWDLI